MWVAILLKALGIGVQAYGQYQAGLQEKAIHEYNAQIAEQAAEGTREKAAVDEKRLRRTGERVKGSQRAAAGASGATMESFEEVFVDTAKEIELDALSIRHAGEVEAIAYEQQAQLSRLKGKAAKKKGFYGGVSSLLSGGGNIMGMGSKG